MVSRIKEVFDWKLDGKEILRRVLEGLIQGLIVSWVILGALGSFVLVYLGLRFMLAIIKAFEKAVAGL